MYNRFLYHVERVVSLECQTYIAFKLILHNMPGDAIGLKNYQIKI